MLTLVLLCLGISFLTFCQHDLFFQRQQQADRQAQALARAAVEYYQYRYYSGTAVAQGEVVTRQVVSGIEVMEVQRVELGDSYWARGRVLDGRGNVVAERVIYVPYGRSVNSYDQRL